MRKTVHVKWERQTKRTERRRTQSQIVAFLVEGRLSENGGNANVLTKLGAIQERFLRVRISKTRAFHQGLFWVKVDRKLGKLGLEKAIQKSLEAQISEKVPRPPDDLQRTFMYNLSLGYSCLQFPLFEFDEIPPDYDELIDLIFSFDEVVSWW